MQWTFAAEPKTEYCGGNGEGKDNSKGGRPSPHPRIRHGFSLSARPADLAFTLEPPTVEVQLASEFALDGRKVITLGFNYTSKSTADILKSIAMFPATT